MNHDRLGKLLAMASSDNDGEALAALRKAKDMLADAGLDFKDVADRVRGSATPAVQFGRGKASAGSGHASFNFDDFMEAKDPGWKTKRAKEQAERERGEAERRAAIVAKYGSIEAAVRRSAWEQALHDAALPWLSKPNAAPEGKPWMAGRWHRDMGGYSAASFSLDATDPKCRAALEAAIPMPPTVRAAREEYRAWCARDAELIAALGRAGDTYLDLPASWRRTRVGSLADADMPLRTLDDLHVRMEIMSDDDFDYGLDPMVSILDAFERLVIGADTAPGPVHSGHPTSASDRRAAVLSMLSSVDTAGWSDRAIAKACGVSPTTVGALRRRTAP